MLGAQSLSIRSASEIEAAVPTLQLALSVDLGERATAALQAGLLLAFDVDWKLADGRQLQRTLSLRYSPLLRSYQLAIGNEAPQQIGLRNGLLAAMENARLRWPTEVPCAGACGGRVRARLNPAALPAPMRLPALFDSDWDFDSGWREVGGSGGDRVGLAPLRGGHEGTRARGHARAIEPRRACLDVPSCPRALVPSQVRVPSPGSTSP